MGNIVGIMALYRLAFNFIQNYCVERKNKTSDLSVLL